MADGVEDFFRKLADRGQQPLLGKVRGDVRFDLLDGQGETERWLVSVNRGEITVSHEEGSPHCVLRSDRALFERLTKGEENATAAVLRGAVVCLGDMNLLLAIQRLFPGPPNQRQPKAEPVSPR
jgi:predicted lipid carrier protein YhbT